MDWKQLASTLFGDSHGIRQDGDLLVGTARFDGQEPTMRRSASAWRSRRHASSSTR